MPDGRSWWTLDPAALDARARWLGLFPRPLPRLPVTAGTMTIAATKAAPAVAQPIEAPPALAESVPAHRIVPAPPRGGSVDLTGLLLEPDAWRRAGPPPDGYQEEDERTLLATRPAAAFDPLALARRLAYLLLPPAELLTAPDGPLHWRSPLFPYQIEGVQTLLARDALLLADDMGLGKTVQAIAALRILALQRRMAAALVVVPAGLLPQWRRALEEWAPELRTSTVYGPPSERAYQWKSPAHVYLTTYEMVRADFTPNPASPPRRRVWDVVVLDEAQRIKNRESQIARVCKLLPRRRAWAITGTPLENRLDDLASVLEFVAPFQEGDRPVRYSAGDRLLERHRALQLRRKKADVLPQLPPKIVSAVTLALTEAQRESYRRAEEQGVLHLRNLGAEARIENVLELVLRLKQICNFCPRTGQSAKLDDLRERLAALKAEGHRALVFSQFTDAQFGIEALAGALAEHRPVRYTGAMSPALRNAAIEAFKSDSERTVLLLSLRAGGQGLNLQEASYVFHLDRWWNPAVERQAEDRSHRLGQTEPVHVYTYTCEGTIEERIDQLLREKQLLFDEVIDDVSIGLEQRLTAAELFGLFGLTPPSAAGGDGGAALPDFGAMSGAAFRGWLRGLLERRGWRVEAAPAAWDGGADLLAFGEREPGETVTLYVACLDQQRPAGLDAWRERSGALPRPQQGAQPVIVCPAGFTSEVRRAAREQGVALWDRWHLRELSG